MPDNVSYGIYLGRQGGTNSAEMSTSTGGYSFNGDALRFRVFDNGNHGFIWENDNNELLMSLSADAGQLYVNAGIITNQTLVTDTLSVGDRGIYSAGDIELNSGAYFIGDGSQLTGIDVLPDNIYEDDLGNLVIEGAIKNDTLLTDMISVGYKGIYSTGDIKLDTGARFIGDGSQLTNIPLTSSPWDQSENKLSFLGTNNQVVIGNLHPNMEAGFTGAAVTVGGGMVITNDSTDTQLAGLFPSGQNPTLAVADLPNYNLWVEDGIMSEMFWVVHPCIWDGDNSDCPDDWGDYVFDETYDLLPLEEVKDYVKTNKHLPGIPSTEEIMRGYELHDMNKNFIVKIEEIMLYTIAQQEKIKQLTENEQKVEQKIDALSKEIEALKKLINQ